MWPDGPGTSAAAPETERCSGTAEGSPRSAFRVQGVGEPNSPDGEAIRSNGSVFGTHVPRWHGTGIAPGLVTVAWGFTRVGERGGPSCGGQRSRPAASGRGRVTASTCTQPRLIPVEVLVFALDLIPHPGLDLVRLLPHVDRQPIHYDPPPSEQPASPPSVRQPSGPTDFDSSVRPVVGEDFPVAPHPDRTLAFGPVRRDLVLRVGG
jgi:hypothetical protein